MINVLSLDHLVLTVRDVEASCAFYCDVLGMQRREFLGGRTAVHFGSQKINLHQDGAGHPPVASHPAPGSADVCFIVVGDLPAAVAALQDRDIEILLGPVEKQGAQGPICSVYVRDPDGNLVELSAPVERERDGGPP